MWHRPVQVSDLPECLRLLPAYLAADPTDRETIAMLWPRLVGEPGILSGVMEDIARPLGQRIQGWGVSMHLSPSMARELELDRTPRSHLARRVYAGLRSGHFTLMDDRQIGRHNAAGDLELLVLHFTMPHVDLADPQVHKVVACAQESFRIFHFGYNWRAMHVENSADMQEVHLRSGYAPRRFADEASLQHLPAAMRPSYVGLTRDEARLQLPGTTVRNCFESEPPRFRFSASQRRLLWFALFDESDDALMAQLEVSGHGLKKLWRGIYERIEDVEPEFFGETRSGGADDDGKRGPEKRRQVLAYVRQRLEELRAWMP
jgi:hypothetical protein